MHTLTWEFYLLLWTPHISNVISKAFRTPDFMKGNLSKCSKEVLFHDNPTTCNCRMDMLQTFNN